MVGEWNGEQITSAVGRFGPYLLYKKHFYALPKGTDVHQISLNEAIEVIQNHVEKNILKRFEEDNELTVSKGRFGAYIAYKGNNYRIPKDTGWETLDYAACMQIIQNSEKKEKTKTAKKSVKKSTAANAKGSAKSGSKTTAKSGSKTTAKSGSRTAAKGNVKSGAKKVKTNA